MKQYIDQCGGTVYKNDDYTGHNAKPACLGAAKKALVKVALESCDTEIVWKDREGRIWKATYEGPIIRVA